MTAIAYRDGVLAADTAVFADYNIRAHVSKIYRAKNGALASASGVGSVCQAFGHWFSLFNWPNLDVRFTPDCEKDDFYALIVSPDGVVSRMDWKGRAHRADAPFHALGGCEELLVGAMAAGASAEEAVRIAIEHHVYAGGTVSVARITGAA